MCLNVTDQKEKIARKDIPFLTIKEACPMSSRCFSFFGSVEFHLDVTIKDPRAKETIAESIKHNPYPILEEGVFHVLKCSRKNFQRLALSVLSGEFDLESRIYVGIIPKGTRYIEGITEKCSVYLNDLKGYGTQVLKLFDRVSSWEEVQDLLTLYDIKGEKKK